VPTVLFTGYINKSMDIVRATHTNWTNETLIAAEAAKEFNAGAQYLYKTTLTYMRKIRQAHTQSLLDQSSAGMPWSLLRDCL
jgi:hypothetical protein